MHNMNIFIEKIITAKKCKIQNEHKEKANKLTKNFYEMMTARLVSEIRVKVLFALQSTGSYREP